MKRIITLLILGVAVSAHAQVSLGTRLDSCRNINNRQITTSTPPNLVYPVQVGSKTDSLIAIIRSLLDSIYAITGTNLGLQQVTDNLDTTDNQMIVGDGFIRTIHNSQFISTNFRTGGTLLTDLGYLSSIPTLYLKDAGSANGAKLISGSLTANSFSYLPNEGVSGGGIKSTLVIHHTKDAITVDATGTGDSTRVDKGLVDVYAPPVSTYNLVGELQPTGLLFGQRNAAHTHQDGLTLTYTADGSNYAQTFQNLNGTVALLENFATPSGEIFFGTGSGYASSPKLAYDGTNFIAKGSIVFSNMQIVTGGDVTMSAATRGIYYDPPSVVTTATITLPASPPDGQEIEIYFGGTIAGASSVVTTLSVVPNGSDLLVGVLPTTATANTVIRLKYRLSNTSWYGN